MSDRPAFFIFALLDAGQGEQIGNAAQMKASTGMRGGTETGAVDAGRLCGGNARHSVFDDETFGGGQAECTGSLQKNFGMGLGVDQHAAVDDGIHPVAQAEPGEDEWSVAAG